MSPKTLGVFQDCTHDLVLSPSRHNLKIPAECVDRDDDGYLIAVNALGGDIVLPLPVGLVKLWGALKLPFKCQAVKNIIGLDPAISVTV